MKKKLEEMLQKKEARKAELVEQSKTSEDVVELRSIHAEMDGLNDEIAELRGMLAALPNEDNQVAAQTSEEPQARSFNPIATYSTGNQPTKRYQEDEEDIYGTLEYRKAFMNHVTKGTPIPEEYRANTNEARSNELTIVGDVAAVIPTTIMNKVIEDLTTEGKIINKITQTHYQGGVSVPISEGVLEPTWLTDENTPSDEQKGKMKASLTFSYHVLEVKVGISLLASTVSLPVFEQNIVKQLKRAMIRAIEKAIVSGTGIGQPLGITKIADLPEENIVTFNATEVGTVKGWAKAESAVDEAYDNDSLVYLMNKQTWEMHLNSMVDTTGQKIGLGRIDEKGRKILNGREVITTDQFRGYDNADEEEVFGVLVNLEQYLLNSNLAMYYKKYFDEDKNKWIHKCLMIADGKMAIGKDSTNKLVGAGGLIYLKKKSASRTRTKNLQEDKE